MPKSYEPGHFGDLKEASSTTSSSFKADPALVERMVNEAGTHAVHGGSPEHGGIGDDPQGCAKAETRLNLAGKMAKGLEEGPTRNRIVADMTASNAMFRHFCPKASM
jgi:hypothetical protein